MDLALLRRRRLDGHRGPLLGMGGAVGEWSMARQVSTNGVLIDYSGFGHHGYYGGVKRAFIGDTTDGDRVLHTPGDTSNYASIPALSMTGVVDLRTDVRREVWAGASDSNFSNDQNSSTGGMWWGTLNSSSKRPFFRWATGSGTGSAIHGTELPFSDGERWQVRVTFDPSTGTATFFYRTPGTDLEDNTGWTQHGSPVVAGATTIGSPSATFKIGYLGIVEQSFYRTLAIHNGTKVFDTGDLGALAQGTRSFVCDTGQTVTVNQSADTAAMPTTLWHDGTSYLWLPGTAENTVTVPDSAELDITADIDLRGRLSLADWTPSTEAVVIAKWPGGTWYMSITTAGKLFLRWYDASVANHEATATAALPLSLGDVASVRATLDVDNGAGGHVVTFYYRTDGLISDHIGWTQLGTPVTSAGTTSIRVTTDVVYIGNYSVSSESNVYAAQIYDGIEGTKVLDIDFTADASYNATHTTLTAVTGQGVTINRSATGLKGTVVTENVAVFDGVDDYIEIDDHARLNFALAESLTVASAVRVFGTNADLAFIAKKADLTTALGYSLGRGTANAPEFTIGDGTNATNDVGPALTQGARSVVLGVRRVASDDIEAYSAGVGSGSPTTDASTGTLSNTGALRIGRLSGAGTAYGIHQFYTAALFRRALSAAQILRLNGEM